MSTATTPVAPICPRVGCYTWTRVSCSATQSTSATTSATSPNSPNPSGPVASAWSNPSSWSPSRTATGWSAATADERGSPLRLRQLSRLPPAPEGATFLTNSPLGRRSTDPLGTGAR
jgi:hypothetical protein